MHLTERAPRACQLMANAECMYAASHDYERQRHLANKLGVRELFHAFAVPSACFCSVVLLMHVDFHACGNMVLALCIGVWTCAEPLRVRS